MRIAIGCDHGGFELKEFLKKSLKSREVSVEDMGCWSKESVDYPDFAANVARKVSEGDFERGIVVCTSGIGVSIVANKFPNVRAALCHNVEAAELSRKHNNSNVLALGASTVTTEEAVQILEAWLQNAFEGGRHERRVRKIEQCRTSLCLPHAVSQSDPEVSEALHGEYKRQQVSINLIDSENFVSPAVREAVFSSLNSKYVNGYPGKRGYPGCEFIDEIERLAIDRAKMLFGAEHVNVQPYSNSIANIAVLLSILNPGDTILSMSIKDGGPYSLGHPHHLTVRLFNVVSYSVDAEKELLNYDAIRELATQHKPKLICAGSHTYSRMIKFKKMREIADMIDAYLMVDMAQMAGMVAAGCYSNPVPLCDFVTASTHKTLRGPRGGMILSRKKFEADINRQIFPGLQGGPLMHVVAGKAIAFSEALKPSFKEYQEKVIHNAQALADALEQLGLRIVSGGTDTHTFTVDLATLEMPAKNVILNLKKSNILANKCPIPRDPADMTNVSGLKLSTAAITTRGMQSEHMPQVADFVLKALDKKNDDKTLSKLRTKIKEFMEQFPIP